MQDRIEKTIELKAPIERVWQALTDFRQFGEWFRVKLDGPFVVGEVTTGRMTYPGYEHIPWRSTTTALESPTKFAFSWPHSADPENPRDDDPTLLVEFLLEATAGGTTLTVVESGFEAIPESDRASILRGNEDGWQQQTQNVKKYVES